MNCLWHSLIRYGLRLENINCSDIVITRETIVEVSTIYASIAATVILSTHAVLIFIVAGTSRPFKKRSRKTREENVISATAQETPSFCIKLLLKSTLYALISEIVILKGSCCTYISTKRLLNTVI